MMEVMKVSTVSEFVEDMKRYTERVPTMDRKEVRESLIRMGVLDADGKPKERICTGDEYE